MKFVLPAALLLGLAQIGAPGYAGSAALPLDPAHAAIAETQAGIPGPDQYRAIEYRVNKNDRNHDVCKIFYQNDFGTSGKWVYCDYRDGDGKWINTATSNGDLFQAEESTTYTVSYIFIRDGNTPHTDTNFKKHITRSDPKAIELAEKHRNAESRIIRPGNFYNGRRF